MNKDDEWEIVDTGTSDRDLMETARTVAEGYEPLITASEFDDPLDPKKLHSTFRRVFMPTPSDLMSHRRMRCTIAITILKEIDFITETIR